jgi:hypothetical protein
VDTLSALVIWQLLHVRKLVAVDDIDEALLILTILEFDGRLDTAARFGPKQTLALGHFAFGLQLVQVLQILFSMCGI